ncbi:MAG TPA: hypothetical protein VHA79_14225 [Mycobacteriales bacterium]|jgi:hypothetical protein|nr:hypothetical protein [Mycobacteriales bacterium]
MATARAVSASPGEPERVDVTPAVGFAWLVEGIRPYLGWVLYAAAAIALFIGWWGVSGTALVAKQLPYIASAGLIGVVLITVGNRVFMTNDLRRDSGRLDRLEQMVAELHAVLLARTDAVADAAPATAAGGKPFRAVPRGTSYHLPECSMVQGKDTLGISRGEVSSRSLKPCRMCHPDVA